MKKIESKKFLIGLLIVATTLCLVFAYALAKDSKDQEAVVEEGQLFSHDIFADMDEMEKEMDRAFERHHNLMKKMFKNAHSSFKNHTSSNASLLVNQNDKNYKYVLKFSDFKKEDIVVGVSNGILIISAKNNSSSKDKNGVANQASSFYYSLALPNDAKGDPEIIREDKKITVKFAKG